MALGTKSREFQNKILHRYLVRNVHLKRTGKINSSACSFCGEMDESLEHLLVTGHFTQILWKRFACWCNNRDIRVQSLTVVDVIFKDWKRKNNLLLFNHILIIAKQSIYSCRKNNSRPAFNVLLVHIKSFCWNLREEKVVYPPC